MCSSSVVALRIYSVFSQLLIIILSYCAMDGNPISRNILQEFTKNKRLASARSRLKLKQHHAADHQYQPDHLRKMKGNLLRAEQPKHIDRGGDDQL
jgi:hypothetical protein